MEENELNSNYGQQKGWERSKHSGQPSNTMVTEEDRKWLERQKARQAASAAVAQQTGATLKPPLQAKAPLTTTAQNYIWDTAPEEVKEAVCQFCRLAGLQLGNLNMSLASIFLKRLCGWGKVEAGNKVWQLKSFADNGMKHCSLTAICGGQDITVGFTLVEVVLAYRKLVS